SFFFPMFLLDPFPDPWFLLSPVKFSFLKRFGIQFSIATVLKVDIDLNSDLFPDSEKNQPQKYIIYSNRKGSIQIKNINLSPIKNHACCSAKAKTTKSVKIGIIIQGFLLPLCYYLLRKILLDSAGPP